jgi:acetyltransferase-like isoleucine patch superfamily enzyme
MLRMDLVSTPTGYARKDVPPGRVVARSPARVVREVPGDEEL